ncbi:glycosyltransferase involved in cell wall biosynthesis [Pedobacter sp. CAN_A7]|uniref:glycosyltransferase family 4 protein n=1 Tax=Pedobacter sp. CAN_A7 TaxID=2787722 RepID=UPI0018CAB487
MKVLYVTNMYPVEDYIYFGIHVKEQIEAIATQGDIETEVYFINGRAKKWNYFNSIANIRNKIKNGNYDLIHIHYGLSALFLLFYQPKIPVVVTLHSGELYKKKGILNHLAQKSITMAALKNTNRIIVLNDDMVNLLYKHKQKLVKLPCGIDLNTFIERNTSQPEQELIVGFPGNKARNEKNFKLFKEIIDELRKTFNIRIVEFHNFTRNEVLHHLQTLDVLVMTSLVEGSPQIIKEAMACNRPIVSTNVGDLADLLHNVKNCHVINSFESAALLKPIREIFSLSAEHRKTNGREKLIQMKLGADQVAKSVIHVYNEVL